MRTPTKTRLPAEGQDRRPHCFRASAVKSLPRPIPVTGRLVSDVLQALASLVIVPTRQVPAQPAWLPAWPHGVSAPAHSRSRPTRTDLAGR